VRRVAKMLALVLLAVAVLAMGAAPKSASATAPEMAKLRVEGGEDTWHADEFFRLDWDQVPGPPVTPSAVVYRLFDASGNQLGPEVTVTDDVATLGRVRVPSTPGVYTIETWLRNAEGEAGPPTTAKLRFDNVAPMPPLLEAPSRWLLGTEPAVLKVDVPPSPHPLSGIRGYGIVLDGEPVDLEVSTGVGSSVPLGLLPEGTTVAKVVAISGAGVPSEVASTIFKVDGTPPALSLQGAPSGWSAGPVRVAAHARDTLSGMEAAGPNGPFTAIAVDGAAPTLAWGAEASTWVAGSGVHEVDLSARDVAGNLVGGPKAPASASALVRIDEDPPRVAFAATQDPSEPERIEATVSDPLSGPSSSRGSIALRPAGTRARFQELPTRVVGDRLITHWDSDAYPHGKYEFLATAFDAAGNAGTTTTRSRGDRMVLVNPVKAQVSLESSLVGRRLSGRLRRLGGAAVTGQEIVVTETFAAGAQPRQRSSIVRTGPDGKFSLRLRPGPSRDVVATFAGSRLLTRATATSAHLSVPTAVRLRASAATAKVGGRPVVFSGKVGAAGAKRAVRGLPVELQFRYPGADWSEFRTVDADARGRFRYAYRFSDDDSRGVRFQFRAYVKGREGWPYEPSASRPVKVAGR
jgi:hypothetical protein